MPKIDNFKEIEELPVFSKISCPKGRGGNFNAKKLNLKRKKEFNFNSNIKFNCLENYSFIVDNNKKTGNYFIDGFRKIFLNISQKDILEEFKLTVDNDCEENYWLDTSFIIKPNMVSGLHPIHGSLKISELSYLHSMSYGLGEINNYFKFVAKEIRKTNNQFTKNLKKIIYQNNVYITSQVVDEIKAGKDKFQSILKIHNQKNHFVYSKIVEKKEKRIRMINSAIDLKLVGGNNNIEDKILENRIYQDCSEIARNNKLFTSFTDNHLVAHALTRAIETYESQTIITRDSKIADLSTGISNLSLNNNLAILPKVYLNNFYMSASKLHFLKLIPEK